MSPRREGIGSSARLFGFTQFAGFAAPLPGFTNFAGFAALNRLRNIAHSTRNCRHLPYSSQSMMVK